MPCSASRCSSRVSGLTCSNARLPTVDPTAAHPAAWLSSDATLPNTLSFDLAQV